MVSSSHPLSVMRVFDIASQFYGFFRTQKILKSEELLPSFTFKQKYRKKKYILFFTSFLDNLKSLKVIFAWLTLMSALFPVWENCVHGVFSSHPLSVMRAWSLDFSGFLRTQEILKSEFFLFYIFDRLTLMSALFPPGKTLCSWCFFFTPTFSHESLISRFFWIS